MELGSILSLAFITKTVGCYDGTFPNNSACGYSQKIVEMA
jgi:hypothetical protein